MYERKGWSDARARDDPCRDCRFALSVLPNSRIAVCPTLCLITVIFFSLISFQRMALPPLSLSLIGFPRGYGHVTFVGMFLFTTAGNLIELQEKNRRGRRDQEELAGQMLANESRATSSFSYFALKNEPGRSSFAKKGKGPSRRRFFRDRYRLASSFPSSATENFIDLGSRSPPLQARKKKTVTCRLAFRISERLIIRADLLKSDRIQFYPASSGGGQYRIGFTAIIEQLYL